MDQRAGCSSHRTSRTIRSPRRPAGDTRCRLSTWGGPSPWSRCIRSVGGSRRSSSAGALHGCATSECPFFSLCVGSTGLLSLGLATLIGHLPPHPGGFPAPWRVVLVYGVMANLCYTLGALADLTLRRALGERAPAVGPVLFRYGFVFSLGLTLLPIPLAALGWLVRWFS